MLENGPKCKDLAMVKGSLPREAFQLFLLDQMRVDQPPGFTSAIEKEGYSTLVRSLALVMALDDLLGPRPDRASHQCLSDLLVPAAKAVPALPRAVEQRPSIVWSHLQAAYQLAWEVQQLRAELSALVKGLRVRKTT